MQTTKLDNWARLLFDTGKRNNLVNFKDNKNRTLEILLPESDLLLKSLEENSILEVFEPEPIEENIIDDTEIDNIESTEGENRNKKIRLLETYSGHLSKNQVLIYNRFENDTSKPLKNIMKTARGFIEETGSNVTYLAFGFVHWREQENSTVNSAPILLVPIEIIKRSADEPYIIKPSIDDILVNPTFSYILETDYNIRLPRYTGEGLERYIDKIAQNLEKLGWYITEECKIGIFSFNKINMYLDLMNNRDKVLANPNIQALLSEPTDIGLTPVFSNNNYQLRNPVMDLHTVVDADSSQIEAIEMAKAGNSFVLQGPPGTGKSQTITNIIAESLNDGKSVLFVSEKLAALEVVYNQLERIGLADFCLELHSHKANKKNVIQELDRTLELPKTQMPPSAKQVRSEKGNAQWKLDAYAYELHKQQENVEKSLYELYESYSSLRDTPDMRNWFISDIEHKNAAYLDEAVDLLKHYIKYIPSIGYNYRYNPWFGYQNRDVSTQAKATVHKDLLKIIKHLKNYITLSNDLFRQYGIQMNTLEEANNWKNVFHTLSQSEFITSSMLNPKSFDKIYAMVIQLKRLSDEIKIARHKIDQEFNPDIYKINGAESYEQLSKQFSGKLSRFFSGKYKQLINQFKECSKSNVKLTYEEALKAAQTLEDYQNKEADFRRFYNEVKTDLGPLSNGINTNWDALIAQLNQIKPLLSNVNLTGFSELSAEEFRSEQKSFKDYENELNALFIGAKPEYERTSKYFSPKVFNLNTAPFKTALAKLTDCEINIHSLDNWHRFRTLLTQLSKRGLLSYIHHAIENNVPAEDLINIYKKQFYYQWAESIIQNSPILSEFSRVDQDMAIESFSEKDVEQFRINKDEIRSNVLDRIPSTDYIPAGSSLSLLKREANKKRRQKSIRTLFSEIGPLVQRIKPVFLMSPQSVSTFLDPNSMHFDVVIFDEASQIFPQDAIGSIYRGDQLIVVGDSLQMPPTNFFNSTLDLENTDEEEYAIADYESILDLCATSFRNIRLKWHYRSRYEQLIAFSNKNFYNNNLITFPSAKTDAPGIGIDYIPVEGVYHRNQRINPIEAEKVVDLIYQNLEEYPERSIGVVALNQSQMNLIDDLLTARRMNNPEKEYLFSNENRAPVFIKNLETVQGDERDTIILSTTYGKDEEGRFIQNFGPLNRQGGERRLNVAITRAKYNMQVVSSMHHSDIKTGNSLYEGPKLLKEYLDYAENGQVALERTAAQSSAPQFDSEFEMEVYDFLRSHGFEVDTQVGYSGFKIDLALRKTGSSDYVLAIECDGAAYHSSKNARDRDRLRQHKLEDMGWQFYRIWSTDWFQNNAVEKQRLLETAAEAVGRPIIKIDLSKKEPEPEEIEYQETLNPVTFEEYKVCNIDHIHELKPEASFPAIVKGLLKFEQPLSEEWLLKRAANVLGGEEGSPVVREAYEEAAQEFKDMGIVRRNRFLFREDMDLQTLKFRKSGKNRRDIQYITYDELACGMLAILEANPTIEKDDLFEMLMEQAGYSEMDSALRRRFNTALRLLKNLIIINGDTLILKNKTAQAS